MQKVQLLVANNSLLIREGLKSIFKNSLDVEIVAEVNDTDNLVNELHRSNPNVVLLDYASESFSVNDIYTVLEITPQVRILALTSFLNSQTIQNALKAGVYGHILNCCDAQEITDAVQATANGDRFFCGKVLNLINEEKNDLLEISCSPVSISERELEVIKLISEGYTNKEIADKLFLSAHTVTTHRKNIMNKLGVNNTAGIVIYAVKEKLISPNKFLFAGAN